MTLGQLKCNDTRAIGLSHHSIVLTAFQAFKNPACELPQAGFVCYQVQPYSTANRSLNHALSSSVSAAYCVRNSLSVSPGSMRIIMAFRKEPGFIEVSCIYQRMCFAISSRVAKPTHSVRARRLLSRVSGRMNTMYSSSLVGSMSHLSGSQYPVTFMSLPPHVRFDYGSHTTMHESRSQLCATTSSPER